MSPKFTTAAAIAGTLLISSLAALNSAQASDNPFAAPAPQSGCLKVAAADGSAGSTSAGGATAAPDDKAGGGETKPRADQSGDRQGQDKGQGQRMDKGMKCGEGKCGGSS
jgi:hypothetical protein